MYITIWRLNNPSRTRPNHQLKTRPNNLSGTRTKNPSRTPRSNSSRKGPYLSSVLRFKSNILTQFKCFASGLFKFVNNFFTAEKCVSHKLSPFLLSNCLFLLLFGLRCMIYFLRLKLGRFFLTQTLVPAYILKSTPPI